MIVVAKKRTCVVFAENLAISPLLIATSEGHVEVVCQLAMYNANLELPGYLKLESGVQRISPFHVALQQGKLARSLSPLSLSSF